MVGVASWYGPGFNGRHTATGEIYDQRDLTAATEVYRLGDRVMVSNLSNGRSVEVMINDRGPFAKGRIIDLSYGAARSIGMIGPGTTRVRLQLVSASTSSTMPRGYYVQAGSFGTRVNADRMRDELARRYSDVTVAETVIGKHHYYRVRMGAFETEQQARARAHQTSGLALPMIIVSE